MALSRLSRCPPLGVDGGVGTLSGAGLVVVAALVAVVVVAVVVGGRGGGPGQGQGVELVEAWATLVPCPGPGVVLEECDRSGGEAFKLLPFLCCQWR